MDYSLFYGGSWNLILYLGALVLVLIVNGKLQSTYAHYSRVQSLQGKTGYQVAREILDANGLQEVDIIQQNSGMLSDFYDPRKNVVSLSPKVYGESSIASISVAAHEVGHAIQHATGYKAIDWRNKILPAAQISSSLSWVVITLGLLFGGANSNLLLIGIGMLCVVLLFQVVTLPIEFDASKRAIQQLNTLSIADGSELTGCRKMLKAAALTYVAGVINSIVQILRLLLINNSRKRD